MKCPYCLSAETKVVDKRDSDSSTRRRRECLSCEKRFTTYERIENANVTILKKDGNRESYDRDKVKIGIQKACEKRPVSVEQIDEALDIIETELRSMGSTEIPSKKVGTLIMKMLRKMDKVAYIRFASVYKDFKDVEEFEDELHKLLKK